jgi:C-terminal processing protease CtpA/Prc
LPGAFQIGFLILSLTVHGKARQLLQEIHYVVLLMRNCLLATYTFLVLLITSLSVFGQDTTYNPGKLYSVSQLKADLHFLQTQLDSIHPGLYHYTTRDSLRAFFDSLNTTIVRPMREQQFLSLIMLLNAKICDGHTMFLPGEDAMIYNNTRGHFLPFTVAFIKESLYITENCSTDSSIQPGTEITRINGQDVSAIMKQLLRRQIRDGRNQTYPLWILNHYFAAYYAYTFGQPALFSFRITDRKGRIISRKVRALTKDSIRMIRQKRYGGLQAQTGNKSGISLEEQKATNTAILTVRSFDADWLQAVHKQDFSSVIDSIFKQLRQHRMKNLLLDLRDNQGGDFETGRHLLSYLVTSTSVYLHGSNESRLLQPKENNFTGKLFVLINGGSFSNTAIVSACLEKDRRATFIGEESGGNKSMAYGEAVQVVLPHTRIQAYISTTAFPISRQPNDYGITPRYIVQPSLTDLLTEKDTAKTLALKLITGSNN